MTNTMNEFEVIKVHDDLRKKGFYNYELRPGNDCIWAAVNSGGVWLHLYYVFRQGRLVDIQID